MDGGTDAGGAGGRRLPAQRGEPWPESVAIVVYSDECMKTNGEDIAEVFALMGCAPAIWARRTRWWGWSLPLAELGRPRIDAVLRISGLFRDTFPNVVELVERAVLAVAGLDEPQEQNFVKKHTDQERERLVAEGLSENEALEQASLRVFGCPPGTYGAGVSKAIHSQNWESWRDLSQVYTLWSAHGYSSRFHGQAMPELFRSQLSSVGMTIKNESSVEIDMLDSDDFLQLSWRPDRLRPGLQRAEARLRGGPHRRPRPTGDRPCGDRAGPGHAQPHPQSQVAGGPEAPRLQGRPGAVHHL